MGICAILRIPCDCVVCTSMLDKPWTSGTSSEKQERGSFKNWNIIKLSQKSTSSDTFDEVHQVFINQMSDNMSSLGESGKYVAIYTTGT